MTRYADFHRRSIEDRDGFWREQAELIDWQTPFTQVCDYSNPPFAKWFVGGTTNLCHNAVDRHLKDRADQNALIFVSTEVDKEQVYSFRQLMELLLAEIRRHRCLVNLPFGLADLQAAVLERLPVPPLTRDQVRLLRRDNVVTPGAKGLADLGIVPTAVEAVIPSYLEIYRRGGRFRRAA